MVQTKFEVELKAKYNALGWKSFECAGQVDTGVSGVVGSAFGTAPTTLTPVLWTKKVIDAAKAATRFVETGIQEVCPTGNQQVVIPIRSNYLAEGDWETSSAEPTSEIAKTEIGTLDGVDIKPTGYTYLVAVTYDAMRTNVVNLVQHCREELAEFYSKTADGLLRDCTMGDGNAVDASLTGLTVMSNTVAGTQTIFGGDATDANDNIDATDVLSLDMFRKGVRLLSSDKGYYWTGNVFTPSAKAKNPWEPTEGEPYVFYTSPEGIEAFHGTSQFTNAAEYGTNEVVMNGEIGKYLGVKVISTSRATALADNDYVYCSGTGNNPTMDVPGHINMMAKAFKYGATAWGQKPSVKVFDYPSVAEVRLMLYMAIGAAPVHPDAIVRMVVADE